MADNSVTTIVVRRVRPGRDTEYRQWVERIGEIARGFPGNLGGTLQGPNDDNQYTVVHRFDTVEHLRDWEQSEVRQQWLAKLDEQELICGDAWVQQLTGLEFLFPQTHPSKAKMALVLVVIVFSMLSLLRPIVDAVIGDMPLAVRMLAMVCLQVVLMVWLVMPRVTRWLAPWLNK